MGITSRFKQGVLAVSLVLGVLLMHGVAADHDLPLTTDVTMSHPVVATHFSSLHVDSPRSGTQLAAPTMSHSMGALCLAILASALLAPLLTALRLGRRRRKILRSPPTGGIMAKKAAAAPWLTTPSLTRLCVSRT